VIAATSGAATGAWCGFLGPETKDKKKMLQDLVLA
jgi:hypothetical protein